MLDYLAVHFAEDGYDLQIPCLGHEFEAYRAQSDSAHTRPGEDYQFRGPVPKRMSAEQLMDTIWQVTQTYPVNAEAKVDRSERLADRDTQASRSRESREKITARWIWGPNPNARKVRLQKSVTLEEQPAFAGLIATLRQCLFDEDQWSLPDLPPNIGKNQFTTRFPRSFQAGKPHRGGRGDAWRSLGLRRSAENR